MGIITYLKETMSERKHINWPTRAQAIQYTLLIILISVVVAVFLGFFDWSFTKLIEQLI